MEGKEKITVVGMLGTAHKRRGWRRKNEGGKWGGGMDVIHMPVIIQRI